MEQFMTPEFWVAVGQIIMIDILLGGDNAVVIAWPAASCRRPSAPRAFCGAPPVPSCCAWS
jgi:predicted tellurium resistance membrane protein TerC